MGASAVRTTAGNVVLSGNPSLEDDGEFRGGWQSTRSNLQWVNHLSGAERSSFNFGVEIEL